MWLHTLHLPHTPWSGTRCPSVRAPNARWRRCVVSYWKSSVPTSLALRIDGCVCHVAAWLAESGSRNLHSKTLISTSPQIEKYAKPKWWAFQKQQISIISRSRIGALKELIYYHSHSRVLVDWIPPPLTGCNFPSHSAPRNGAEESPAEERPEVTEVEVVGDGKGPRCPLPVDPSMGSVPTGPRKIQDTWGSEIFGSGIWFL